MENNRQNNIINNTDLDKMTYRELSVLEKDVQSLLERVREQKQEVSVVEIMRLTEIIQDSLRQIEELGGNREKTISQLLSQSVEKPQEEIQSTESLCATTEEHFENPDQPESEEGLLPLMTMILGDDYYQSQTELRGLPLMIDLLAGNGLSQLIQVGNEDVTEKNENPQWGRIYSTEGLCPTLMHTGKTKVVRRNDGIQNPNKVRIECPNDTHKVKNKKVKRSVFSTLGASNHCDTPREQNDYYATDPRAVEMLCDLESFNKEILEPCCGEGHISEVLKKKGYNVTSRDLIDRGYGEVADFLDDSVQSWNGDIVTNPPYTNAQEFVEKSLDIIPKGNKVAMFLKLQFLESKKRKEFLQKNPPKVVYVSSSRLKCGIGGDFDRIKSSAISYAWFVWEKGYTGDITIKLFN